MGDLTSQIPKCLLPVAGRPILDRALETLTAAGINEVVAVVGYREEMVRSFLAQSPWGNRVTCISNRAFAKTNTVYSLWLGRRYLDRSCYLIEGDIVFGPEVIKRISSVDEQSSVWTAVPVSPDNCTGIVLSADDQDEVREVALLREPEGTPRRFSYRCAGIQRLTDRLAQDLATTLQAWVNAGRKRIFADLALAEAMQPHSVRLCHIEGLPWCEVDSADDLERSEAVFRETSAVVRF
jgi:choline kinase